MKITGNSKADFCTAERTSQPCRTLTITHVSLEYDRINSRSDPSNVEMGFRYRVAWLPNSSGFFKNIIYRYKLMIIKDDEFFR